MLRMGGLALQDLGALGEGVKDLDVCVVVMPQPTV